MEASAQKLTFAEHIHELRKRLMWSLLFVVIGAGVGYMLHDAILVVLQSPLNESLYYTTPTGAFSFIIKVCAVFGFIVALPVVVYQCFGFFGPLLPAKTRRSMIWYVFISVGLAAAGITFAYFVSLPAALHFLVNFGNNTGTIEALITADEYFNFVLAYIAGFAALFQLPLVITFINKVTPLKPKQLMGGTRYVILGSFVAAAIITPTPDPINQALMAGPIILLYFLSVSVIAFTNRAKRRRQVASAVPELPMDSIDDLLKEDDMPAPAAKPLFQPTPAVVRAASVHRPVVAARPASPRRFVSDMVVPSGRVSYQRPVRSIPQASASRLMPRQPAPQAVPRKHQARPTMRMGVISDFIPASE